MMATSTAEKDFYSQNFQAKQYLDQIYNENLTPRRDFILDFMKVVCEIFQTISPGANMLEFGSGPSIAMGLCASGKATNISYAEYTRGNRDEIQKWIERDPDAHDWSAYSQFVGEIQSIPSKEVESRTHSTIKEILYCNALAEDPIESSRYAPFDIILSSLCLHVACPDAQSFNSAVQKLSSLLKPGGHFIICGLFGQDFYQHGETKFPALNQTQGDVEMGLREAGLKAFKWWIYDFNEGEKLTNATQHYVVYAKK